MIGIEQFLTEVFGADAPYTHSCSFLADPMQTDRRDWFTGYIKNVGVIPDANSYYCISQFYPDPNDTKSPARRRKLLFKACHVIVLDDVHEKLPIERVKLLPEPSYVLETSPGSEQWGYILETPCTDRAQVENLLDGLVRQGLAPDGKDPGMKGVTRLIRLPTGINSKASKMLPDGTFPKVQLSAWNPERRHSMESLAAPFYIDLSVERSDSQVNNAADLPEHPVFKHVNVKSVLGLGKYDITCPFVADHTNQADDGCALFVHDDGGIAFACHHACSEKKSSEFIDALDIKEEMHQFKLKMMFNRFTEPDFMGGSVPPPPEPDFMGSSAPPPPEPDYQDLVEDLTGMDKTRPETVRFAEELLVFFNNLSAGLRNLYSDQVRSFMGWTKSDVKEIVKSSKKRDLGGYDDFVYIVESDVVHNIKKRSFSKKSAFFDDHIANDPFVREVFEEGRLRRADRLTYIPGQPQFITDDKGNRLVNSWGGLTRMGVEGDISLWWNQFDLMGWAEHRKHISQWMAFTMLRPELKINHIIILGGGEGIGKDMLLEPLKKGMQDEFDTINGKKLLSDYNGYLMDKKYLSINEVSMGNRKDAQDVYNNIKDLATAPPDTHKVSKKYLNDVDIPNIVNVSMTTNSPIPLATGEDSRRFYPIWSDLKVANDPAMKAHFKKFWNWYRDGGIDNVIWYLRNQVDLSDFDHDMAPEITSHMKDMNEMTMDPVIGILKELIDKRFGCFSSDVVTNKDIQRELKVRAIYNLEYEYDYPITAQLASKKIMEANIGTRADVFSGTKERGWIIRNFEKYTGMGMAALGVERAKQLNGGL